MTSVHASVEESPELNEKGTEKQRQTLSCARKEKLHFKRLQLCNYSSAPASDMI